MFTKKLLLSVEDRAFTTISVMSFIYGVSTRDTEMVNSLDLSVAPFVVVFKKYVEQNIKEANEKLSSTALATGYKQGGKFIESKVRT